MRNRKSIEKIMTKKQTGTGSSNKIANKLIRLLKRGKNQKVVDLNLVKQIRQLVSEQKPPSPEEMSGSHPA